MKLLDILPLIACLLLMACQSDSNKQTQNSERAQAYWEDYESPEFKWGYINSKGEISISPIYDDLKDFQNGLAAVNFEGKWGYINTSGGYVIEPQYMQALDYEEGSIIVQDFQGSWILLDEKGSGKDTLGFENFKIHSSGHFICSMNDKMGLIDNASKILVPFEYEELKPFNSDLLIYKQLGRQGLIDLKGNIVLANDFSKIYPPIEKHFRVKRKDRSISFYQEETLKPILKNYKKAFDFYEDQALVLNEKQYFIVDKDLKPMVELDFEKVKPVGQGYYKYKLEGKYGLLDPRGKVLTAPIYDAFYRFNYDRLAFNKNGMWGYLDEHGEEILEAQYQLVWDFNDGIARVIANRGVGFINTQGDWITKDIFFEVRDFNDGLARFQTY